jgi:flagellar motility protein MotE (MotC chaperone)
MTGTRAMAGSNRILPTAALLVCLAAPLSVALAAEAIPEEPKAATAAADPADDTNAALYCRNIANAAADARYARQVDSLAAMEKALDERIAELEKKRAELEEWVKRREAFLDRADESVVAIYAQMRPDAAAQQIAVMEEGAAAAILSRLTPRTASAILNEMEAATAAHLTNVMAGEPMQKARNL